MPTSTNFVTTCLTQPLPPHPTCVCVCVCGHPRRGACITYLTLSYLCSSHHTATGIVHFHNTAMLRRVAPRILQASSGRPRRVSGSATEDKERQEHVAPETLLQTCKQVVQKNWEKWLLAALGGLGCLAYAYCTDTFQVWWTDSKILAVPFEPTEEAAYVRDVVTEKAEDLRRYVKEYDKRRRGCFVLVAGPQASGKTTSIETAFDGWKGIATVKVNLDATAVEAIDFAALLIDWYLISLSFLYPWSFVASAVVEVCGRVAHMSYPREQTAGSQGCLCPVLFFWLTFFSLTGFSTGGLGCRIHRSTSAMGTGRHLHSLAALTHTHTQHLPQEPRQLMGFFCSSSCRVKVL